MWRCAPGRAAGAQGRRSSSAPRLGGVCLNWGCIPTKALLKSAQVYHLLPHRPMHYGADPRRARRSPDPEAYRRPLARRRGDHVARASAFLLEKNDVDLVAAASRPALTGGRPCARGRRHALRSRPYHPGHGGAPARNGLHAHRRHEHVLSSRHALALDPDCPKRWSSSARAPSAASSRGSTPRSACGSPWSEYLPRS